MEFYQLKIKCEKYNQGQLIPSKGKKALVNQIRLNLIKLNL